MLVAPVRHAVVQPDERGVPADHVGEHREEHAAHHDHEERERQPKAGRGLRIEPGGEGRGAPGMAPNRRARLSATRPPSAR